MKRKVNINNVAYADSVGYSCIVPKEKGSFCNLECNPKPTVNYSSAFKIAGALIWPMALLIIAIKIKRSYNISMATVMITDSIYSLTWGVVLSSVFINAFILVKAVTLATASIKTNWYCYGLGEFYSFLGFLLIIAVMFTIVTSIVITAKVVLPYHLPVPRFLTSFLRLFTLYSVNSEKITKIITIFGIWNTISAAIGYICFHIPIAVIAILTDPYRNGFLFASEVSLACGIICLFSAFVTLDQIFTADNKMVIVRRESLKKFFFWLFLTLLALCVATFLAAIHCLILMDLKLPLRYSINFSWYFSSITTILIPILTVYLNDVITKLNHII